MRPLTIVRIARDVIRSSRVHVPIALRDARSAALGARDARGRQFVRHVISDVLRYSVGNVRAINDETLERAALAAAWLARAQNAAEQGGLSYGYLPCRPVPGWQPAYPETSGYTIPSLFDYARLTDRHEYHVRAVDMARFVMRCQMPSGAIYGGTVRQVPDGVAVAFNTGMVLLGLLAAYRETREPRFAASAKRAAEFLRTDIGPDGNFRSHGPFVHENAIKTYTCLCAWPLWCAAEHIGDERLRDAAYRVADAALAQQRQSGWFDNNCLSTRFHAPLLHTIGYTLQGLLEIGILTGRTQYVDAVKRAVDPLLPRCAQGFLHGRWYDDWQPAAFSSCLTGSAQIAVVCYRLADHTRDARYRHAADCVLNYLKALQSTTGNDAGIVGAIAGSFPLTGAYIRFGFPGWATKFYLDALIWQHRFSQRDRQQGATGAVEPAMALTRAL
jgi:rhamnogalacturonyl hydrolase YesR